MLLAERARRKARRFAPEHRPRSAEASVAGQHRRGEHHQRLAQDRDGDDGSVDERDGCRRRFGVAAAQDDAVLLDGDDVVALAGRGVVGVAAVEAELLRREGEGVVERLLVRPSAVGCRSRNSPPIASRSSMQVVDRLAAQVEVAPPRRLALAPVVEQQVREQPPLGLVGRVVVAVRRQASRQRLDERECVRHPIGGSVLLLGLGFAVVVEVDPELCLGLRGASSSSSQSRSDSVDVQSSSL